MPYKMFELHCHFAITYVIKRMKKMFEGISLSLALFDHLEDSVRIMLVIGQCNRTVEEDVIRNT